MLAYNFIGSSLVALSAFSFTTIRAPANWEPSAVDWTIGAQTAASERALGRDSDASRTGESMLLRRGLCELGNRPRYLSKPGRTSACAFVVRCERLRACKKGPRSSPSAVLLLEFGSIGDFAAGRSE
jgi:hypothetical protein